MIDKLKDYLLQVAISKYLPMAVMAAFATVGTFLAAHQAILEPWGVNYIPDWSAAWLSSHPISGQILLIEVDTISLKSMAALAALVAVVLRAVQHHTTGSTKPPAAPPVGMV